MDFLALRMRTPVLHRFGQMFAHDAVAAGKVRDGAGDAQDAVVGAGGQREFFHSAFQQRAFGVTERAVAFDFAHGEGGVGFAGALHRDAACSGHACAHGGGIFVMRATLCIEFHQWNARHVADDVDAVQQWSGNAAAIACDRVGRAMAAAIRITRITARARVQSRNCCLSYFEWLTSRP